MKNSAINFIIVAPEGFLPSTWIKRVLYLHGRLYHLLLQKLCCSVTHTEYDKWMYTHKLLSFKCSELVIFFKRSLLQSLLIFTVYCFLKYSCDGKSEFSAAITPVFMVFQRLF